MTVSISQALLLAIGLVTSALSTAVNPQAANTQSDIAVRNCEWYSKIESLCPNELTVGY